MGRPCVLQGIEIEREHHETDHPPAGRRRHDPEPDRDRAGAGGHHPGDQPLERREIRAFLDPRLVHIQRPVDLHLHRMVPARGPPIGLGDIGPGERRIAHHPQTRARKGGLDPLDHVPPRRRTEPVAQHHNQVGL